MTDTTGLCSYPPTSAPGPSPPPPTSASGRSRSLAHLCPANESIPSPHLHRNRIHPPPTSVPPLLPSGTSASAQHRCDASAAHRVAATRPVLLPSATGARSRCRRHMLQPAARCRAALRLAASDPIQASEAKAPLAESLGVCAALTRIGFDVSEAVSQPCAVPLTAPSVPAATGSEDSVDVRVASFCSEQSWPTACVGSLPLPRPRPPGSAAYTSPTRAHCPPLVAAGRPGIDVRRGGTFLVAGEGCRGCPGTGAARGRFAGGGPARFGGTLPAGHGARQAARRARTTAERRAASLGRRLRGGSTEWEARESTRLQYTMYRLGSLPTKREWSWSRRSRSKMLRRSRCAAYWRAFLAPSLVRREASVWVSVSGPLMPSSHARFGLAVSNPALTSGTSQAISMLHAGARPCRSGRQVP